MRLPPAPGRCAGHSAPGDELIAVLLALAHELVNQCLRVLAFAPEDGARAALGPQAAPRADERPLAEQGRLPSKEIEALPVLRAVDAGEKGVGAQGRTGERCAGRGQLGRHASASCGMGCCLVATRLL